MYIRHFLHVDSLLVLSGDHQGTAKEFLDVCSETGRQLTERDAEKINCPLVHKQYEPAEERWNLCCGFKKSSPHLKVDLSEIC